MSVDNLIANMKVKMDKSIISLEHDLSGLRTGRASANLLNPVVVEVYGDRMPVTQLATITTPDARTVSIQVWSKENVKAVEKAIANANLGITPISDGQIVRLSIPTLSEERRKEMAKLAAKYGENCKIAIRNIRRDAVEESKAAEKAKQISEDESKKLSEQVQKTTDDYIKKIDNKVMSKEKEIIEV